MINNHRGWGKSANFTVNLLIKQELVICEFFGNHYIMLIALVELKCVPELAF